MSLVDHWPFPTFRVGQKELLEAIEREFQNYEVFVIRAPVGFGKEPIGVAMQSWAMANGAGAVITVPNNLLRDQVLDGHSHIKTVKAKKDYLITTAAGEEITEAEYEKRAKRASGGRFYWKGGQYHKDLKEVKKLGTASVVNYYSYLAHKLYRPVLIVDEAHQLLSTLQSVSAKTIWRHLFPYPRGATSLQDIKDWLDEMVTVPPKLGKLQTELDAYTPATLMQYTKDFYKGALKDCLKILPFSVENEKPIFWPPKTKRIVLMSATIGEEDLKKMGLGERRTIYIDVKSPIPVENRPIKFDPVADLSFRNQGETVPVLVAKLLELADSHENKGLVHAPYELALKLKELLPEDGRFLFHTKWNKKKVYSDFYDLPPESGKILVGSGMSEGLDLKYDVAEWQVLCKCPYPSLADPAMRYLANEDSSYYTWLVSREIMQASGRICRAPDDFGITYMLDEQFNNWYTRAESTLPSWFKEAIV